MRRSLAIAALASAAVWISACGAPVTNTANNANSNANAKPMAAAPTTDALLSMDKEANDAWIKGDTKFFDGFLSDKFVEYQNGKRMGRADVNKMIADSKCDMKSWSTDDPQMAKIDNDTYVISYKATFDGTCSMGGKSMKVPSPVRAASVYVREGDKWKGVFHGENLIMDAKSPAASPASADTKKEPKKDAMTEKEDMSKKDDMAKKEDKPAANANSNMASNTAAPAAPAADSNTDALVKLHAAGWEAWRNKDAKQFEATTTKDVSIVDPAGVWVSGQSGVISHWTGMKCEGVTKTSFTEGFASALSPTVEILTGKGNADGSCDGHKNGDLYSTAFYVKEGDAWKLAFMFESMPMPGM